MTDCSVDHWFSRQWVGEKALSLSRILALLDDLHGFIGAEARAESLLPGESQDGFEVGLL